MSFLTEEYEKLVSLMARSLARTHGQIDSAETYAGTVLDHAKAIAEEDAAKVKAFAEPVASAPVPEAATTAALPPGDQPAQPAA